MLADAGIDKIKDAISKKKLPGNMMLPQVNEVVSKTRPGREPRAIGNQLTNNYNVSFNNSFNTLQTKGAGVPQEQEIVKHQVVQDLEERLTNRLTAASDN